MTFVPASDPGELGVLVGGLAVAFGSLNWMTARQNADPGRIVAHCASNSLSDLNFGTTHRCFTSASSASNLCIAFSQSNNRFAEEIASSDSW